MDKERHTENLRQGEEIRRPTHLDHQENHFGNLHLWMTTQEAAEYSGYDIEHVRRLARQGKIGAEKKGHDWWTDREAFTVYVETIGASPFYLT